MKRNPAPFSQGHSHPSARALSNISHRLSISAGFPVLDISQEWNPTGCGLSCPAEHLVLEFHPCCSLHPPRSFSWLNGIPACGWTTFCSPIRPVYGCGSHRLTSGGGAAVSTCVHTTVWTRSHWWQRFVWRRVTLQLTSEVLVQVHIFVTLGKQT